MNKFYILDIENNKYYENIMEASMDAKIDPMMIWLDCHSDNYRWKAGYRYSESTVEENE